MRSALLAQCWIVLGRASGPIPRSAPWIGPGLSGARHGGPSPQRRGGAVPDAKGAEMRVPQGATRGRPPGMGGYGYVPPDADADDPPAVAEPAGAELLMPPKLPPFAA